MSKPLRCKLGLHHWHYFDSKILDGAPNYAVPAPQCYRSRKCAYCPKQYLDEEYSLDHWFQISEAITRDNLSHNISSYLKD